MAKWWRVSAKSSISWQYPLAITTNARIIRNEIGERKSLVTNHDSITGAHSRTHQNSRKDGSWRKNVFTKFSKIAFVVTEGSHAVFVHLEEIRKNLTMARWPVWLSTYGSLTPSAVMSVQHILYFCLTLWAFLRIQDGDPMMLHGLKTKQIVGWTRTKGVTWESRGQETKVPGIYPNTSECQLRWPVTQDNNFRLSMKNDMWATKISWESWLSYMSSYPE